MGYFRCHTHPDPYNGRPYNGRFFPITDGQKKLVRITKNCQNIKMCSLIHQGVVLFISIKVFVIYYLLRHFYRPKKHSLEKFAISNWFLYSGSISISTPSNEVFYNDDTYILKIHFVWSHRYLELCILTGKNQYNPVLKWQINEWILSCQGPTDLELLHLFCLRSLISIAK